MRVDRIQIWESLMKKLTFAAAVACAMCVLPAQANELTSTVNPSNCKPVADVFVVPAGSVAKDFALSSIKAGKNCVYTDKWEPAQFEIRTSLGYKVYGYINRNGSIWEEVNGAPPMATAGSEPVALRTLVLQPGSYFLDDFSGVGGHTKLTYNIRP
jgi:hypothetical protein